MANAACPTWKIMLTSCMGYQCKWAKSFQVLDWRQSVVDINLSLCSKSKILSIYLFSVTFFSLIFYCFLLISINSFIFLYKVLRLTFSFSLLFVSFPCFVLVTFVRCCNYFNTVSWDCSRSIFFMFLFYRHTACYIISIPIKSACCVLYDKLITVHLGIE